MPKYRIDSLGELARQMGFTPLEIRRSQLDAAEHLLHEIDPARAYPVEFVIYRITGYQPRTGGDADLLTGLALQHDLGVLIEQVSATLGIVSQEHTEPVLSIDDVAERFHVTSKTIQRWRRKGLPARRFIFADGRQRVGFLLSSVERFVAQHADQLPVGTNLKQVDERERQQMLSHACCLTAQGWWEEEITRRIGKRLRRSPLAVLHTIRKYDVEHPDSAVFARAAAAPTDVERSRICRGFKGGMSLRRLGARTHRSATAAGRIVLEQRIAKLNARKIKYIDDPLYHDGDAERVIGQIVSQQELPPAAQPQDGRLPRDLPPYLRELYRVPLLSPLRERALFLKFNFHKYQFAAMRRRLEPQFACRRDLDRLEQYLHAATATKNDILRANLRLVVSVARKHVRPGVSLMELVSDGNLTLMRAVEGFDPHKGNRFSTYATLALMKGFARGVPLMLAGLSRDTAGGPDRLANVADARLDRALQSRLDREHLWQLLSHLDEQERQVLLSDYGLETPGMASSQRSPQRFTANDRQLRQIRETALAKLRRVIHGSH